VDRIANLTHDRGRGDAVSGHVTAENQSRLSGP
jgi:hypothetical protein